MKLYKPIILFTALTLCLTTRGSARESASGRPVISHVDSVMINFRQSKWNLDRNIGNNAAQLDSIDRRLKTVLNDSVWQLRDVSIYGGASPEGSVAFNKFLSEERAATLFRWFDKYDRINGLEKNYTFYGRDWEGVLRLAVRDAALPYRDETLVLLTTIVEEKKAASGKEPPRSLERIKSLRGGEPYRYLYRHIFPKVRASKVVLGYERIPDPLRKIAKVTAPVPRLADSLRADIPAITGYPYVTPAPKKPFYMDIRTNMLYDLLAVPNIGVEFYLGKNWSIAGYYMHAWWSHDPRHRYWRLYGGGINMRRWFGKAAEAKPLTGHHLGAYIQAITYDFEWGGKAQMGGKPGGTIWDLAHFGAGMEYGYALPVGRRFNIDFTLAVGYTGGKIHEFEPMGDRYVWLSTKRRNYFGPTRVEVSLVWLIGRGNFNVKNRKGGSQ